MKKLMFLFLFLFVISQCYSQTKYLTGSDSINYFYTNNAYELVYVEVQDTANSVTDSLIIETYSLISNRGWDSVRVTEQKTNVTAIKGQTAAYSIPDGSYILYLVEEKYPLGVRARRLKSSARLKTRLIPIKTQ